MAALLERAAGQAPSLAAGAPSLAGERPGLAGGRVGRLAQPRRVGRRASRGVAGDRALCVEGLVWITHLHTYIRKREKNG